MTTLRILNLLIDDINAITGSPKTPWKKRAELKEGERVTANIGNYHLSQCYGGVNLHRMVNDGGGVTTPIGSGHDTKRKLEAQLRAYINGLTEMKDNK